MTKTLPAVFVAAMAMLSAADGAAQVERLVVLGDSLSDVGNAAIATNGEQPSEEYYNGRFSNGPLWVDRLAAALDLPLAPSLAGGTGFAHGGATVVPDGGDERPVPTLPAQADTYRSGLPATGIAPGTLIAVWGGGNDILDAVSLHRADATAARDRARAAAGELAGIVRDLAADGAGDILVLNQPDIGALPRLRRQGSAAVGAATSLTDLFNRELDRQIGMLRDDTTARLTLLDVHAVFDRFSDPDATPFANITEPCLAEATACSNPDAYMFWDEVHPTAAAHAILAAAVLDVLPVTADQDGAGTPDAAPTGIMSEQP
jgi:outer membrane lipase/esterase